MKTFKNIAKRLHPSNLAYDLLPFYSALVEMEFTVLQEINKEAVKQLSFSYQSNKEYPIQQLKNFHLQLKPKILNSLNTHGVKTETYVRAYDKLLDLANKKSEYTKPLNDLKEKIINAFSNKHSKSPYCQAKKIYSANLINNHNNIGKPPAFFPSKIVLKSNLPENTKKSISRNEVISEILEKSVKDKNVYFDFEYRYLNRLACWIWQYDHHKKIKEFISKFFIKECLEDLEERIEELRQEKLSLTEQRFFDLLNQDLTFFTEKYENDEIKDIIKFARDILQKVNASEYLPANFENPVTTSHATKQFPGSKKLQVNTEYSAHNCGKVIGAAGPEKEEGEEDKTELYNFLNTFFILKNQGKTPTQILSLGDGFLNYFTDQETMHVGDIVVKRKKDTNEITLLKGTEKIDLTYYNIDVEDNHTINLDYSGLMTLTKIYKNAAEKSPVVVHCTSGVGRTGQIRFIFALLDKMKIDFKLKAGIDKLIRAEFLLKEEIDYIATTLTQTLFSLRKTRLAILIDEQYIYGFRIMLLLRAVQLEFQKNEIKNLHKELMKPPRDLSEQNNFTVDYEPEFLSLTPFTVGLIKSLENEIATVAKPPSLRG